MKKILLFSILLSFVVGCSNKVVSCPNEVQANADCLELKKEVVRPVKKEACEELQNTDRYGDVLCKHKPVVIMAIGQGVAPCSGACSPAQSYALAKRAAIADSYRLIAEKVRGVYVEGQDLVQNMMVKRSTVRTHVNAMIRNANIVETTFKDGLCEVEMEITLHHSQFTY